jgi:glycosyltransferase involved in cell wall biosynthesis
MGFPRGLPDRPAGCMIGAMRPSVLESTTSVKADLAAYPVMAAVPEGDIPPLRILHVSAPGQAGGLESVIATLTPGLRARGHGVGLAAMIGPGGTPPFLDQVAAAGVEVHPIRAGGRAYLRQRRLAMELARSWRADVVHTHGYHADVVVGTAAARAGFATVSTVHGFTGGDWKNRIYEILQSHAFRQLSAVVAVSGPLRARLAASGVPATRLHLIRNAWGSRAVVMGRAEAREWLGLPREEPVVGWVGRLSAEKGPDVFLAAIGLGSWRASLVGDGRLRAHLERMAAGPPLSGRVRFHGLIPDAGRLVSAFDVLVLSSLTEGTPIVLFEAMEAGVPIVATAVGGVPDVLGPDEALLVPPGDSRLLAGAIRRVFDDPAGAAARATCARVRLAAEFAPGPWLDQYESLYRSLLPDSRRSR